MKKLLLLLIASGMLISSCASNTVMPREDLWKHVAEVNRDVASSNFEVVDRQNTPFVARRLLVNDSNIVSWVDEMDSARLMAEAKGFNYSYKMGGAIQGGLIGTGIGIAGSVIVGTSLSRSGSQIEGYAAGTFSALYLAPIITAIGFGIGYLIGQPVHYSFPD